MSSADMSFYDSPPASPVASTRRLVVPNVATDRARARLAHQQARRNAGSPFGEPASSVMPIRFNPTSSRESWNSPHGADLSWLYIPIIRSALNMDGENAWYAQESYMPRQWWAYIVRRMTNDFTERDITPESVRAMSSADYAGETAATEAEAKGIISVRVQDYLMRERVSSNSNSDEEYSPGGSFVSDADRLHSVIDYAVSSSFEGNSARSVRVLIKTEIGAAPPLPPLLTRQQAPIWRQQMAVAEEQNIAAEQARRRAAYEQSMQRSIDTVAQQQQAEFLQRQALQQALTPEEQAEKTHLLNFYAFVCADCEITVIDRRDLRHDLSLQELRTLVYFSNTACYTLDEISRWINEQVAKNVTPTWPHQSGTPISAEHLREINQCFDKTNPGHCNGSIFMSNQ
jgi:hypothetical protein